MDGYEKFKEQIYTLTGLNLSLYKERQMKRRIESLISRNNIHSYSEYIQYIKSNRDGFDQFINYLTINVSEFYRNANQWEVLEKSIFPELIKKKSKLKIWSAACSTGEEPYSLVMCLSRLLPLKDIHIEAVDFDEEAISKAKMGIYGEKSIKNIPMDLQKKYFTKIGNSYKIDDQIKSRVTFKKMNLLKDSYGRNYDLIVCRNVMIYFTEEAKDAMYHKFYDALDDGGYFFVGSTEQIIQPQRYNFESKRTFFYQK